MIYLLTYRRAPRHLPPGQAYYEETKTTTWCVPTGWSEAAVIADFERQFSGSKVLSLVAKELQEVAA